MMEIDYDKFNFNKHEDRGEYAVKNSFYQLESHINHNHESRDCGEYTVKNSFYELSSHNDKVARSYKSNHHNGYRNHDYFGFDLSEAAADSVFAKR